jgi:beta-ribofuranosylaminobenzene 5'-phosphate synthase
VAEGDLDGFGRAIARLGRLNGAWYADEQGGVYRPPAGQLVEQLTDSDVITGAGQSSWGPTVYGVTSRQEAEQARQVGERALEKTGVAGTVRLVSARDHGASVRE